MHRAGWTENFLSDEEIRAKIGIALVLVAI